MADIKKIKAGQTLYDVRRNTGVKAWGSKYSVWPVYVVEVNQEENYIIARWNEFNAPRKMGLREINKLRYNPPK